MKRIGDLLEEYDEELEEVEENSAKKKESQVVRKAPERRENGMRASSERSAGKERDGRGNENRFRRPMIFFGILFAFFLAAFGALVAFRQFLTPGPDGKPVISIGKKIGGGEAAGASGSVADPGQAGNNGNQAAQGFGGLSEEEAVKRLAEEYSAGRLEGERAVLEQIKNSLNDGTTVVETLRPLYKDQLVVASSGVYHFIPIREDLKKNAYEADWLNILDSGELQYGQDGEVTSYKGIDVSKFQGKIDWQKVAQDGVSFAFVRAGFRGYGEKGTLMTDDCAEDNLKGANAAGIKVGVYFYTQAITREEALEEADLVIDLIRPYRIDCPVVIDVEKVSSAGGRMNKLEPAQRTEFVKVFCERIKEAGYRPMIYHNLEMGALMLDLEQLEEYDKWFAYYKTEFYYPYDYKVWQYSDKGKVDGVASSVDMNIAFEPLWQ